MRKVLPGRNSVTCAALVLKMCCPLDNHRVKKFKYESGKNQYSGSRTGEIGKILNSFSVLKREGPHKKIRRRIVYEKQQ